MIFGEPLFAKARQLLDDARARGLRIAVAESCTGGLIAGLLTEIPGSSDVVERGFVTYSNEAKEDLLGVPMDVIHRHGAVSAEVARTMAEGALKHSLAQLAVAVTGIAGPGGGTVEKPVGLVYLAAQRQGGEARIKELRLGDIGRGAIRLETVAEALKLLRALI
jgi:nicotinamide-nucleotide amidase